MKSGYVEVLLSKSGVRKHYQLHRLVLATYNPVENMDKLDVNHIDENKRNNALYNLEWKTHKDNCNYGSRNKKISKAMIGNRNG